MRILRGNRAAKDELLAYIKERVDAMLRQLSSRKLEERTSDELRGAIAELYKLNDAVIHGDET